jgi:hypothetical protein
MELGLPGFSRNTHPTVLPPQHILGQICQPMVSTSREKLIDFGDISRLRVAEETWYDHTIRSWCRTPLYHSFQINHMRNVAEWPEGDPENYIHGLTYDQYKATWFSAFLWKARSENFFTQLRFNHIFQEFEQPDWLQTWWETFGLHPVGINPQISEYISRFEPWDKNLEVLGDLYTEEEFRDIFIQEKHPWVIRTKFMFEEENHNQDTDPILLRQVYTMHWDPYNYHFNHWDRPPD